VHAESPHDREIELTLDVMTALVNRQRGPDGHDHRPTRAILDDAGFTGAAAAPQAAIHRLERRMASLFSLFDALAEAETVDVVPAINAELASLPIAPALTDHTGEGLHVHWTRSTARFDDQVVADILMALARELTDHGTARLGRCGATDCDDLFFDVTRNRSRRFCADPRCASRTHTAEHRARRRAVS
jgi:predicted RNA-binding Zn ribbon-like protein